MSETSRTMREASRRSDLSAESSTVPTMTARDHLVEPGWLYDHLEDDGLRIVDMRGVVETRTVSPGVQEAAYRGHQDAYDKGHIPGAVYVDWTRDIVDPTDPVPAQVAPPDRIREAMEARGIGDDTLVVTYDDHPASQFATRLWWALRYYGHDRVRVLNGGWKRWLAEGLPVSQDAAQPPRGCFTPRVRPEWRVTAEEVARGLREGGPLLVDARDEGQYTGAVRRGPRGGHIPGARHLPRERLFLPDGRFRLEEELRDAVREAGLTPDRGVIAYCNGGVAATSVLFALDLLGFPRLSNYDGSWNEWGARLDLPVERPGR